MTKVPTNEQNTRRSPNRHIGTTSAYDAVSRRGTKVKAIDNEDMDIGSATYVHKANMSESTHDSTSTKAKKPGTTVRRTAGTTGRRPSDEDGSSLNNSMLSIHANALALRKLETYKATYIKTLGRLLEGEINAESSLTMMALPLEEFIEAMFCDKEAPAASSELQAENFRAYVYNDAMLAICFLGKAKSLNNSDEAVETLAEFIYYHAMRVDYLLEHLNTDRLNRMNKEQLKPQTPRIVFKIWETLLNMVSAKDRKMRLIFITVTEIISNNILQEADVPQGLLLKHIDTFIALLADTNKDIRCKCIELLGNFQDDRVTKEITRYIGDPIAAVRMAAVTATRVPNDIDQVVPVLNRLISHLGDVSTEVKVGVYEKLSTVYSAIPVELCTQIMCYGLQETVQTAKEAFLEMLKAWIDESDDLVGFISDMISHADDITVLEAAVSFYMENTDFLDKFSIHTDSRGNKSRKKTKPMDNDDNNIQAYMKLFLMLSPAELVLLSIFYQNRSLPEERKLINVADVISYAHFLLTRFCGMPAEPEQIPQRAITATSDDDMQFVDAQETNEGAIIHEYNQEEENKLKELYGNMCLVSHGLRALLVITHCHSIEDSYQLALVENMCDKVLMHGPVRINIKGLMTDVVSQTTLGTNSFYHTLPSKWLKGGFTFAAISLLRYVYARKFRIEGKFMGDDPQVEKQQYEVSITRKLLAIISDIKDPFQTSGISNISIRREELERMELSKIQMFDPTNYSIEHLHVLNAKLIEQMEQTYTQQVELANVKSFSKDGNIQQQVLQNQEEALELLLEKQEAFANVIRRHMKERWTRIMAIVESFLGQTQSLCSEDAGLAEFPRAILLPQMSFFCSTVVQWHDQSITDQYCDVLTSKCLGTWCMLNNGRLELWRQLNAFHVALKGALVILEGFLNQANETTDALNDVLKRRIEMQTLRCEMYMTTLTDLLVTNVEIQHIAPKEQTANHDLINELKSTIFGIIFCDVKSSKYVQSLALRLGCKLLLTEFMKKKQGVPQSQPAEDTQKQDEMAVLRLRGLLELVFVAPTIERELLTRFKFIKNTQYIPIAPEDKNYIVTTCSLYPTLSFRHLRNFHKVLEQVLMHSIHHALQLDLRMGGFANLISFAVQTIIHKSPIYFSVESLAKYFKWLMLITIDKGTVLADRGGFMALIDAVIIMFIKHNTSRLVDRLEPSELYASAEGEALSMSDLCAKANPKLALLDLRDMQVLLKYMAQGGFVKAKNNVKTIGELIYLLSSQMQKIARKYANQLTDPMEDVYVECDSKIKIVFAVEESVAFGDLVDAYDAYVSGLGERELCALLIPRDDDDVNERPQVSNRRITRGSRSTRASQSETQDDDSSGDEDYVVE
ncbi:hypothetical protein BaOVIS_031980 [Babesia ovis]|uniref:Uncharacterized protein n=1 Tax=Babesia ovis TaxID=5869 RepID=A0A9W5TF80_BABOV|nr:hypothetical protein BaOVIS_031980 [Babesia ovis]